MSKVTLVTGLWNIGRDSLGDGWSRSFDHYLKRFEDLLKVKENLIIFGEQELEKFVWERRSKDNTMFIVRGTEWFQHNDFYDGVQRIRLNPKWYSQSGWLVDSAQGSLELYNPLVMSKVFLLNDARILDKFNSEYLFWIDAGLTNTVHYGYFTHDKVLDYLPKVINKFSFVCFPYNASNEIHGFSYPEINKWAGADVKLVGRGGFFGGPVDTIQQINEIYYNLLTQTIKEGLMGTEESIFSIMVYKYADIIDYFQIEENGLMGAFFEELKNRKAVRKNTKPENLLKVETKLDNIGLYVITFNSPSQFETLIKSMLEYDRNFIDKPKKFLLDNSSDLSTTPRYKELCKEYGFTHIKKKNLGICGGRQFVAEHADKLDLDGYWWSEDDMFFQPDKGGLCRNGFNRYVDDLYNKCVEIVKKENLDFLKINFSEFFGDNSTQWSWYNVPQTVRENLFPEKPALPVQGLDPNAPRTKFNNIKSHKGIPYATGEIYYCNWTHLITREGNKKMFLKTKWDHPFENTWMSHIYQETIKGNVTLGLLLITPIEHNRFEFYDKKLRKES